MAMPAEEPGTPNEEDPMGQRVQSIKLQRVEQPAVEALALGTTIPGKSGWVATIEFADGGRMVADKVDGETVWLVNGEWTPGCSMPRFWNGALSRCTAPIALEPHLVDAVEREHLARLVVAADENRTSLR